MSHSLHAHAPFGRQSGQLEYCLANGINLELFFSGETLDALDVTAVDELAVTLKAAGLATTFHAPFMDLNPGALDAGIRAASRRRIQQVFQVAERLRPKVIVVHPGYDDLHYGETRSLWVKNSIEFWQEFVPCARELGTILAIENIYEKEPSTLKALLDGVADPCFRHCFDVGHWNMFTTVSLEEWFRELGSYIVESHIHDNHGQRDEHLPVGEGDIDFPRFFALLKKYAPSAVWTIEAHSRELLLRAREGIGQFIGDGV